MKIIERAKLLLRLLCMIMNLEKMCKPSNLIPLLPFHCFFSKHKDKIMLDRILILGDGQPTGD